MITAHNRSAYKKGFTLVELLLYIGISSILLLGISSFFWFLLQARVKNQVITEVNEQGMRAMQVMTQTIRNATAIDNPPAGSNTTLMWVEVPNGPSSPTYFTEYRGAMTIAPGSRNNRTNLTNSRVTVSNAIFTNLSQASTPGTIQIQFTLTYVNTSGNPLYNYTKTFVGSATLRP